jgi:hypothetical protein
VTRTLIAALISAGHYRRITLRAKVFVDKTTDGHLNKLLANGVRFNNRFIGAGVVARCVCFLGQSPTSGCRNWGRHSPCLTTTHEVNLTYRDI